MKWWKHIGLSTRIIIHISLLLAMTIFIGISAIWYTIGFYNTIDSLVGYRMESLQSAREMENALANQKGFVTYYFLDGDPKWLQKLTFYRQSFTDWLQKASNVDPDPAHTAILEQIADQYRKYIDGKDRVIALYREGRRKEGEQLHWKVRTEFFDLNHLCQKYESFNQQEIDSLREMSRVKAGLISTVLVVAMLSAVVLGVLLMFMLFAQVIGPIRRLAKIAQVEDAPEPLDNEVAILSRGVRGLVADMDRTRTELEQSKELLLHSEKFALVGKLATEVAHSIRNPMTSINMRLFSLQRNLEMTENQQEDLAVVAEEMQRLDNIVRNFLEFSRPHKLQQQHVVISDIIDMTLELLEYRLELHDVHIVRESPSRLPAVSSDPELMKEVFVNLIVNACEAMGTGGRIFIVEEAAEDEKIGQAVIVKLRDTGPGIPEEVKGKVLEPFFTTKPDGTGLGLFIVSRIVTEHGGRMDLSSVEGEGTTFIITLPVAGEAGK